MRVINVTYSESRGGADRAASRIHNSIAEYGLDSKMCTCNSLFGDRAVSQYKYKYHKLMIMVKTEVGKIPVHYLKTSNKIIHSAEFIPSFWSHKFNASDADLIHLHWVNSEMMSIEDIASIRKPLVWTLHDMWAFCGAEHVTQEYRWKEGYYKNNRPNYESGFDLNRWVWKRKRKHWKKPINIVAPSRWLAECVSESKLMQGWPVTVIPNAIDTEIWNPVEKNVAREILSIPKDIPVLLFGADGIRYYHKGYDLLLSALEVLRGKLPGLKLVVFGQQFPVNQPDIGIDIQYVGYMYDDISLRVLYSAADAIVVPSRVEAFGQAASEAHCCALPVIAFNTCGLKDIVEHKHTGYLAEPFDIEDLARGIQWVLDEKERYKVLCRNARNTAVSKFHYPVVACKYSELYQKVLKES
jgi:glycosyltransferase involved in cell wall biosynthesis